MLRKPPMIPSPLTWTYDKIVSGFQLYRYYNFPDGSGRKELHLCRSPMVSVTMTAPTPSATRIRTCLPYTEYEYQIQTRNNNKG